MDKSKISFPSNYFAESSNTIATLSKQEEKINRIVNGIFDTLQSNGKLLIAGNGGSCADAEHFAGELVCTYKNPKRYGFPAVSLSSNSASLTAWGNDFGFETHFERQVESLGQQNDVLFLISTGGGDIEKGLSINLIKAANKGIEKKLKIFSLIGKSGGELEKISDEYIKVKSNVTSHIQEAHIAIIHYICESLDNLGSN